MSKTRLRPILDYYQQEQSYLKQAGQDFAQEYPKIARRLDWNEGGTDDPHVGRLLDSFAFLAGRLQRDIDDKFPRVAGDLLGIIHPHLVAPIPPLAIAQIEVDPRKVDPQAGYIVPRQSVFYANASNGATVRFQSCYNIHLWPVEVSEVTHALRDNYPAAHACIDTPFMLRIRLKAMQGSLSQMNISKLQFCLRGPETIPFRLYEVLFAQNAQVVLTDGVHTHALPENSIEAVGYGEDEDALLYPSNTHAGFRLLQEYFAAPDKFLFFNLANLDLSLFEQEVEVLISWPPSINVDPDLLDVAYFQLGCTPLVNLYSKTTEPFRLNQQQYEYNLVVDHRTLECEEIHTINEVLRIRDGEAEPERLEPFFGLTHAGQERGSNAFWYARRLPLQHVEGSEFKLGLIDQNLNPQVFGEEIVYAKTTVSNRDLACHMSAGTDLQIEDPVPAYSVRLLTRPSAPVPPPYDGQAQWALIKHLSTQYLSFADNAAGLGALKDMLVLYSTGASGEHRQAIESLVSLNCERIVRRLGDEPWRGFVEGVLVNLRVDESVLKTQNLFLFMTILDTFFQSQVHWNSFTELWVQSEQRADIWHKFRPQLGAQWLI